MVDKSPYIEKLKQYYSEKFHAPLSTELAHEYFDQLVALIECIYRPIPEELDKAEEILA